MLLTKNAFKKVSLASFAVFLLFSCSKDADLLSEYVVAKNDDLQSITLLADDSFFMAPGQNSIMMDVLNNDNFSQTSNVTIVETSSPVNGTVTINDNNTLTYKAKVEESVPEEQSTAEVTATTPEEDTFTYTAEVVDEETGASTKAEATVTVSVNDMGELKAFPLAYGAGAFSIGGRGQSVYKVTNLNNSGAGSFRDAVSASNRTIVFDVSGTIDLTSTLAITASNLTIAGQTAPSGGISITGIPVQINNTNNIIIRYIRFRPDYDDSGTVDALNVFNVDNLIVDHCSISWGGDEAFSIIGDSDFFTLSNSIVGESTTGMLLGSSSSDISDDMSVLGNIFYNISHRFPNANASRSEVINNIVHNWYTRIIVVGTYDGSQLNQINNYYQRGSVPTTVISSTSTPYANWLDMGSSSDRPNMRIHTSGNIINDVMAATDNQTNNGFWRVRFAITSGTYAGTPQWAIASSDFFVSTPYALLGADWQIITAAEVLTNVPTEAGANRTLDGSGNITKDWDVIDDRYLSKITTNTYDPYVYTSQSSPTLDIESKSWYQSYQSSISATPINSRAGGYDSDNDGMPDVWEIRRFENLSRDGKGDINGDGYTDLEEFLNLVDF